MKRVQKSERAIRWRAAGYKQGQFWDLRDILSLSHGAGNRRLLAIRICHRTVELESQTSWASKGLLRTWDLIKGGGASARVAGEKHTRETYSVGENPKHRSFYCLGWYRFPNQEVQS